MSSQVSPTLAREFLFQSGVLVRTRQKKLLQSVAGLPFHLALSVNPDTLLEDHLKVQHGLAMSDIHRDVSAAQVVADTQNRLLDDADLTRLRTGYQDSLRAMR